jgi:hypothetical protein
VLNLFYEEPDGDRWLPLDRYPRRIVRRVLRGQPAIGGQKRVFLNLCAGLDRLGVRYRVNDYDHARQNPKELVCIVGKAHVLDKINWQNPILFGAAVFSHPLDDPQLFARLPVRKVLVPGAWMKEMWRPYWDEPIAVWPTHRESGSTFCSTIKCDGATSTMKRRSSNPFGASCETAAARSGKSAMGFIAKSNSTGRSPNAAP